MYLQIRHQTEYRYSGVCTESHNEIRVQPFDNEFQRLLEFKLQTSPAVRIYHHQEIGGTVHHFSIRAWHERLVIEASAIVETLAFNPFSRVNLVNLDFDFYKTDFVKQNYAEFLVPSLYVPHLPEAHHLAVPFLDPSKPTAVGLLDLNRHFHEWLSYDTDATHVQSTLPEVLQKRAGVCQDFAHLMLAACRSHGIPARYVSGYLYIGKDSSMRGEQATHAWIECLMPDGKWVGFDPTNNLLVNNHYVKIHWGLDYGDVSPTKGVYIGPKTESLSIHVGIKELVPSEVSLLNYTPIA